MKGFVKTTTALALIIFFIGLITFVVDYIRSTDDKKPIAAIEIFSHKDGGTKEYFGVGYKVIAYNKLNGYNKIHIGSYLLSYDDKLGQDNDLAELCKLNVEEMKAAKLKNVVEITSKEIKNRKVFFTFIDAVERKDTKKHELNFINYTKEGDKIRNSLVYENEKMFYTLDRRSDRTASELEREAIITYELEPLIRTKTEGKNTSFIVHNKSNNEEIVFLTLPQKFLSESN